MKKMNKFYDTSSLLLRVDNLFDEENNKMIISSITLKELENIKTDFKKDPDIKYSARKLLHLLNDNPDKYEVIIFTEKMLKPIEKNGFVINDDARILATAIYAQKKFINIIFYTNDVSLKKIAEIYLENVASVNEEIDDDYTGYKKVVMNDNQLAGFYSFPNDNMCNVLTNQYLLVYNDKKELIDTLYWTGSMYKHVGFKSFYSQWFGEVKPYKNDPYQVMAFDSLSRNKITMLKGKAGSGKSYVAISYLLTQMEKGNIDKIIVFCNTVAAKGAAKLGFYPGSRTEKLLDSQIGNMLSSKLGGRIALEDKIEREQIVLLPFSDIRGYDTTGMNAGIYITEAQNLDVNLMKLALQRVGEDSICIIDGDYKQQLDDVAYGGANNGMRRVSQVFRGEDIYGEVELGIIHRSRIANIAEKL